MKDPYEDYTTDELDPCLFTLLDDGVRLTWEMIGSCNLGCKHCCIDATANSDECELTLEKAKEVTEEIAKQNVRAMYISGGEPLLWEPLPEFIKYSKNIDIKLISMATNGSLVNPDRAQNLKDAGVDKVLISLDSHREDIHDEFRCQRGVYRRAVNAIEFLKEKDIFVRVGTVIWSKNVNELEDMTRKMYEIGASEIAFSWIMKSGRALQHPEIFIPQNRYFEVGNRLKILKADWKDKLLINYHRFDLIDDNSLGCNGGVRFLHIDPQGHLSPCSWITKLAPQYVSRGTIYTNHFDDLINEGPLENFRSMVNKRESFYGAGCPAVCLIEKNKLFTKDPLYKGKK